MIRFASVVRMLFKLGGSSLAARLTSEYPRILMYHRFYRSSPNGGVSEQQFETQVAFLARHCECLTISDLMERINDGGEISAGKPVACITVDDGYADFFDIAYPILRKYRVPATFYVTTGFVDREHWFWYDRLKWIVSHNISRPVACSSYTFNCDEWNVENSTVWSRLVSDCLKMNGERIEELLETLSMEVGVSVPDEPPEEFRAVTWMQLRELQDSGIEIGGHTVSHYSLGAQGAEGIKKEIATCRDRLEKELGSAPKAFCYPNGQPNDIPSNYSNILHQHGFESSVVAFYDKHGISDRYALRRHGVGESWYQFQKTIFGVDRLGAMLLGRDNVFDWGDTAAPDSDRTPVAPVSENN